MLRLTSTCGRIRRRVELSRRRAPAARDADRLSSSVGVSNIVGMSTTVRNRLKRKDRGPGGKRTRSQRTSNLPIDDDVQTQIEAELASSGRHDVVPREGLVGAHRVLRQPINEMEAWQDSYFDEPFGVATEVAPTERAIVLEHERHRLQRAAGVVPAGEDGNLRQQRAPGVTRSALDAAAREANHHAAR